MKIKSWLLITLLGLGLLILFGGWWDSEARAAADSSYASNLNGKSDLVMLSGDAHGIDLQAELSSLTAEEITIEGQTYTRLTGEGYGFPARVGMPELPVLRRYLEIPYGATYTLEIVDHTFRIDSLAEPAYAPIYPFQPSVMKSESKAKPDFVIDEQYYATGGMYPTSVVTLGDEFILRGHRILTIEVWPAGYDPSAGLLRTTSQVTFRVKLQGSDMEFTQSIADRYASPGFDARLSPMVLNYNQGLSLSPNVDVGYLIITADEFYDAIQPFVGLRQDHSFDVTVTKTSEIPGGATTAAIKAYILNAYQTWPLPPSYVLLVGDTNTIPTWSGDATHTSTDLYYATMDGDSDWHPDIGRGRFPVRSVAQLDAMVDKYLTYSYLTGQEEWLQKAAFPATCDLEQIAEGSHNYVINTHTANAGKYGFFPVNPTPGGDKLYCVTYDADRQDLITSFNDGRWVIIYSGHGGFSGWEMDFTSTDVSNLTNVGMYPFVASHACVSGDFDEVEVFGETWVLEENKGALVFWGSSDSSYWDEDDVLERRMFDSLFTEVLGYVDVATMTDDGLAGVELAYPDMAQYYWETYNILGDPAVKIFMEPEQPSFTLDVYPSSHSVCTAGTVTSTVEIGSLLGYSETVYLESGALPVNVVADFDPSQAPAPYSSILTLDISPGAPTGDHSVVITATDQVSFTQDSTLNLRLVNEQPSTPLLISPEDGAIDQPAMPTLAWEALLLVDSYNFQLASTPLFEQPLFEAGDLSQPEYTLPTPLEGGACYWWHAQANNACGEGEWAAPFHFATVHLDTVFFDDMESGNGLWSHAAVIGLDHWQISDQRSHSPENAWYVPDDGVRTDSRLWNQVAVQVVAGTELVFWHQYQFEGSDYDGSVLEISLNDGTTWQDLGAHITENGYTGVINGGYSNPLSGRQAWVGDLTEWTQVVVDLDDFAGESVLIRWRLGCDTSVSDTGWFIDDVAIVSPLPANPAPLVTEMLPDQGSFYTPTPVQIFGSNFIGQPAAKLDETWLLSVTLVSSTTIDAVVPAGLATGYYDLTLYNGDCQEAELLDAFLIAEHEPPEVVDDFAETLEDTSILIDVLANDHDPEGGDLILTDVGVPLHGQTDISGTLLLYIPNADYFGDDTFTYTASDGDLFTDGNVVVSVVAVNDAPVVISENLEITPAQIQEGETLTLTAVFTDLDLMDAHTALIEWGDGSSDSLDLAEDVKAFSAQHQYLDNPLGNVYLVDVSVTDAEFTTSASAQAIVDNVAPLLEYLGDQFVPAGEALLLSVDLIDPGLLDAHTVTVDWADGVTETIELDAGVLSVNLQHIFYGTGSYPVYLTLVDDDDAFAELSFTVTVSNFQTRLPIVVRH